jgi:peptidoglycan/LPS O-acetylase OafA/YrhL
MKKICSLGAAYSQLGRKNSLNVLRLALAAMVIFAHYFPITGSVSADLHTPISYFAGWAVPGFFAISGFLIAGSYRNSSSRRSYFRKRFWRIYPAFWLALLVVAFVIAPSSWIVRVGGLDNYPWIDSLSYISNNFSLIVFQHEIGTTLQGAPLESAWNGSLWTLAPEFVCYLLLVPLYDLFRKRTMAALLVLIPIATAGFFIVSDNEILGPALRVGVFFLCGALIFEVKDRILIRPLLIFPSLLAILAASMQPDLMICSALPMAFVLISLGTVKSRLQHFEKNDYSYGIYLYGFPVQQFLVALELPNSFAVNVLATLSLSTLFAVASWRLLEKPVIEAVRKK